MKESEGLRLYREHCEARMPDDVRGFTWLVRSNWVATHIPVETLSEIYVQTTLDLSDLVGQEVDATDDDLEESLYVVLDILWHAMPRAARERAETTLARSQ